MSNSESNSKPDRTQPAVPASGALAGLRVLDLSRVLAGPLCAQLLGDHGADVIKIESPVGDETRALGPPFDQDGVAAYFGAVNRNKRGLALDLAQPAGREVLLRLLDGADVLVENFLPGTMARWGVGYHDTLAARFPRLIYCAISGFGADGPLGGLPGYDAIAQAMGGAMAVTGTAHTGPLRSGVPMVDILVGHNAFAGVLLALAERTRSGRGQQIETTLYDNALSLLIPFAANWMMSGRVATPAGNAHVSVYPYDRFTAGGRDMFLGVVNQGQYARLCEHIERPDLLTDARFLTNAARVANRDALRGEIERTLADKNVDTLCATLMANGIPAGVVNSIPQAFEHAHTAHRDMRVRIHDYQGVGIPVKLDRTPGTARLKPPRYGEHADTILAQAGYSPEEITALRSGGVLLSTPRSATKGTL